MKTPRRSVGAILQHHAHGRKLGSNLVACLEILLPSDFMPLRDETLDVGVAGDIHPKNKEDVGDRLALWALKKAPVRGVIVTAGSTMSRAQ